jgi:hypothetical protein
MIINEKTKSGKQVISLSRGSNELVQAICDKCSRPLGSTGYVIYKALAKKKVHLCNSCRAKLQFGYTDGLNWKERNCKKRKEALINKSKHFISCKICGEKYIDINNISGALTRHIIKKHKEVTLDKYSELYPEQKFLFKSLKRKLNDNEAIECKVCGERLKLITNTHLAKHNLTKLEYKEKYGYQTISKKSSEIFAKKLKENNYNKDSFKKEKTNVEKIFMDKNKDKNILSNQQLENKYFDFTIDDEYIEIDGIYWHGLDRNSRFSYKQIKSILNDNSKNNIIIKNKKSLKRYKGLDETVEEEPYLEIKNGELIKGNFFKINIDDVILEKSYLEFLYKQKGRDWVEQEITPDLFKFIREFSPEFPYFSKFYNDFSNIRQDIKPDNTCFHDNMFLNKYSSGNKYLKSIFNSYWESSFKSFPSPVKAFKDDNILIKIIKNRIGLNNNNEIFDFSLKTILNGMRTLRYTISFFNPKLACNIYKHFCNEEDIVLDISSGFGGRHLGFHCFSNNKGKYIGLEINEKIYNEQIKLKNILNSNSELYNIKSEDFNLFKNSIDFIFTSIPYYNIENYNNLQYKNYEEWYNYYLVKTINNCFNCLKDNKKLVLNVNEKLKEDLIKVSINSGFTLVEELKLKSTSSHFSKNDFKYEPIIVFKK